MNLHQATHLYIARLRARFDDVTLEDITEDFCNQIVVCISKIHSFELADSYVVYCVWEFNESSKGMWWMVSNYW